MPYKISGKTVYVYKQGRWQVLKRHPTKDAALAHLRALRANVEEAAVLFEAIAGLSRDLAIDRSVIVTMARVRADKKRGRKPEWEATVNEYQRELAELYEQWALQTASDLADAEDNTLRNAMIAGAIALLLSQLRQAGRAAITEGYMLGLGDMVEPGGESLANIGVRIRRNETFLDGSLGPALTVRLLGALADPEFITGGSQALFELLQGLQPRIEGYAGAQWEAINYAVGEVARAEQDEGRGGVWWILDPRANHCEDCITYGDNPPGRFYESWDAMMSITGGIIPAGGTICLTNCRCSLVVETAQGARRP